MTDYDRRDFAISVAGSLLLLAIILAGGPVWAVIPIGMICCTITLYRHFDLPPHRR